MNARIRKAQLLFISLIHEITGSKLPLHFERRVKLKLTYA